MMCVVRLIWLCRHKPGKTGALGEFSEPEKLLEISRNSVQPEGENVTKTISVFWSARIL